MLGECGRCWKLLPNDGKDDLPDGWAWTVIDYVEDEGYECEPLCPGCMTRDETEQVERGERWLDDLSIKPKDWVEPEFA